MEKRPTPIAIRDGYPWMTIDLAEHGVHAMCIPSGLAISTLVKSMDETHLILLSSLIQGGTSANPAEMLSLLKDAGPEVLCALGALIGMSWAGTTHTLTSKIPGPMQGPALLTYGGEVYEELHSEGYRLEAFLALGMTIMRAIWEQSQFTQEVSLRAAFFSGMGANNSPDLTPGSSTSEIPGVSTD